MQLSTQAQSPLETLHPLILKLLKKRGLTNDEQILHHLSWDLKNIPNLGNLIDLDKASDRIIKALQEKETIGIYGDYDVDGTSACALLYHFFQMLNHQAKTYQPDRFNLGYGLHTSIIDQAIDDRVSVLITVDCGITNVEAAQYSQDKNLDLIITDHHKDAAPELPKAFCVINPNRRDELDAGELKNLSGVGVAFALAYCIQRKLKEQNITLADGPETIPSIYNLLIFVAIGSLCDMVPLSPMNLRLIRHGLKAMKSCPYPGINLFLGPKDLSQPMVPAETVTFSLGPHINAMGRLQHPQIALNLLTEENPHKAIQHFDILKTKNRERRSIQDKVYQKACSQLQKEIEKLNQLPPAAILYQSDWHEGIIGIVASKIVENFQIPALIFTDTFNDNTLIKSSGRSAGQLDLFNEILAINQEHNLLTKFGGHKKALGLTMPKNHLSLFKNLLFKRLENKKSFYSNEKTFDLKINLSDIDISLIQQMNKLAPFGTGNTEPVFYSENIKLVDFKVLKNSHVKWVLSEQMHPESHFQGISFFYLNQYYALHPKKILKYQSQHPTGFPLRALYKIGLNHFKGKDFLQLSIIDLFFQDA